MYTYLLYDYRHNTISGLSPSGYWHGVIAGHDSPCNTKTSTAVHCSNHLRSTTRQHRSMLRYSNMPRLWYYCNHRSKSAEAFRAFFFANSEATARFALVGFLPIIALTLVWWYTFEYTCFFNVAFFGAGFDTFTFDEAGFFNIELGLRRFLPAPAVAASKSIIDVLVRTSV